MASIDLTIMGAGIFGLSIAWAATKRGARVQVIDPQGVAAGSSGGVVGALAPHVPENWNAKKAFQLESLLMAAEFWREVHAVSGSDPGYIRSGRLQPIADAHALALARSRTKSASELWGAAATWTVEQQTSEPWRPPSASGWVIRDTLSALIHPANACQSLAEALRHKGAMIRPDAPLHGPVIWATGVAGLEALNQSHHRSMGNAVKGQAAVLQHDAGGAPQIFADGVHIIPHLNGTIGIGSTSERDFDTADGTDTQLDDLIAKARSLMPMLTTAPVIARWAGLRPRARSRAPMLGPWPQRPGHFIANGGFKIGFGMAPKVAEVMADLVLDGTDGIPAGFRVEDSL